MATPCVCLKETWPQEEVGPAPKRSDSAMRRFSGRSPPPSPAPPGRAVSLGLPGHKGRTWADTCPSREPPSQGRGVARGLHPRGESFPGSSQDDPVLPSGWPLRGDTAGHRPARPTGCWSLGQASAFSTQTYPGTGRPDPPDPGPVPTSCAPTGRALEETAPGELQTSRWAVGCIPAVDRAGSP